MSVNRKVTVPVGSSVITPYRVPEFGILGAAMARKRQAAACAAVIVVALLMAASGSPHATREGGTFRVAVATGRVDTIDPALIDFPPEGKLLGPACATLMAYPDKPPPAGSRLAPDIAEAEPVVARDGKTYTFTIRKDARFSDGAPVTARAFTHALERIFTPAMQSPNASSFEDIVGAAGCSPVRRRRSRAPSPGAGR